MRRTILLVFVAGACTSSSQRSANLSQAANFDQMASAASTAVTRYDQAAATTTNQAECKAALQQYVATMQPLIDQMRSVSSPMDSYMKSAGNMTAGDMQCGVQVMADELAHHQAVACTSSDMAANHAEVQRDVDAMMSFTEHMQMRAVQAGGMMVQGGMMSGGQGPMMDGGWMAGGSDGGWQMPDGGMMNYDKPMPGCTYGGDGYQVPDAGYMGDGGWVTGSSGAMMDGGSGVGTVIDGGTVATDGGAGGSTMMDGGTFSGALTGGAMRCDPPNTCPGPMMMAPNYICADGTVAGPACIALGDGTCGWRMLACP